MSRKLFYWWKKITKIHEKILYIVIFLAKKLN